MNDIKIIVFYDGYIDKKIVEVGIVVSEGGFVIFFILNEIIDIFINVLLKDVENIRNVKNIVFKDNLLEKVYFFEIKNIV